MIMTNGVKGFERGVSVLHPTKLKMRQFRKHVVRTARLFSTSRMSAPRAVVPRHFPPQAQEYLVAEAERRGIELTFHNHDSADAREQLLRCVVPLFPGTVGPIPFNAQKLC